MRWSWLILIGLLSGCYQETPSPLENEVELQAAVQLNAGEYAIVQTFHPLIEETYHLRHHFVANTKEGESYLVWAYFVKEAMNIWRIHMSYDNQAVSSQKLVFASTGKVDVEATRLANNRDSAMPLRFEVSAEGRELLLLVDFATSTQYALLTAVYYIVSPDGVYSVNRAEPLATSLVAPAITLDSSELLPVVAPFDEADTASYSFVTSSFVYDSLGMQHTLYLYFVKLNADEWQLYPRLVDSAEQYPEDGWAEQLAGGTAFTILFDASGGASMVNGEFVLDELGQPSLQWSLQTGAVGRSGEGFAIRLDLVAVRQEAVPYVVHAISQNGGW